MHSSTACAASVLAAIAALPAVYAHGYVENAIVDGKTIFVGSPQWMYNPPQAAGWYANNQDNGFVSPDAYGNADIICHKNATPGPTYLTVAAGSTIGLQWNTWPDSHKGPVNNYLASAGISDGDFSKIDKTKLSFFNAQSKALLNDNPPPGTWETDTLIANDFTGEFTIPASVAPGYYVLRHEIIGLHSANNANGAQNYPQCINLKITGSGSANPCSSGADCRVGTKFFTASDPGILIDIYSAITNYVMPGPKQWGGSGSSSPSSAGPTSAKPTSAVPTSTKATTAPPTTMKTTTKASTAAPPPATSTAPSTGTCAAKYAQCGGSGFTGPTCCASGSTCTVSNQYYSQCL